MSFTKILVSALCVWPLMLQAAPSTIELTNGDELTADLIKHTDSHISIVHPVLGKMQLSKSKISRISINDEANEVVATAETTPAHTEKESEKSHDDNGLFGTGLLTGWERRFDLGIAGSAGKSQNHQVNLGFTADYESEYTRIAHRTAYFRAKSEDELSDHSFYSSVNRDWLRPSTPWFQFAGGRFDMDEFKDWDYRVNGNAGVGYEFSNTESFLLLGRTGLGFNQTLGGEREEFTPEGLVGIESQWDMNDQQRIKFANTLYPSLKDTTEYRNLTSFDWLLDVNSYAGVALKVGLLNEYDSATEQGIDKNDFKYTVSLAWTL
ncbi:DUF481 domain-containing protein [Methylophaga thiooxydans]|nr:DUF481 domain-containing protein [Methylophaga thiooxydans]